MKEDYSHTLRVSIHVWHAHTVILTRDADAAVTQQNQGLDVCFELPGKWSLKYVKTRPSA